MASLDKLILKLTAVLRDSLEQAIGLCMHDGHYNVEWQHWLLSMLTAKNRHFTILLESAEVSIELLKQNLLKTIAQFQQGNNQTPVISPRVIELMEAAWSWQTLNTDKNCIDMKAVLKVLTSDPLYLQLCASVYPDWMCANWVCIDAMTLEETLPAETRVTESALKKYATNLTQLAREGKIDPAIGREKEIRQLIDILGRRRQNNAILTGEPGVGKTAIVEGLALMIAKENVPDAMKNVDIYSLDMGLLQAGASVKGEFEKRLTHLIRDIQSSKQSILLFIDEAHGLIGAGGELGQGDAANLLKPALARGELRCIAATTWSEYKKYFEKDPALTRRFQIVKVAEPAIEVAIHMLRSLLPALVTHHSVVILDEAVVAATELSARYIAGRLLPDKSISVLDTVCSRVASQQTAKPLSLELLESQYRQAMSLMQQVQVEIQLGKKNQKDLQKINKEIKQIQQNITQIKVEWHSQKRLLSDYYEALHQQDKKRLQKIEKQFLALKSAGALLSLFVDAKAVANVIADWTGIPVGRMQQAERDKSLRLALILEERIIGQRQATSIITDRVLMSQAKLNDMNKPMGVFLLVGPSGVGKTESAVALAEQLYGSQDRLMTINMSEFKEEHKVALLTGAPPGYVGYGEGGVLTEAIRRQPYSLVLLDEMEKAHPGVQELFYSVFDKGEMRDSEGRIIDCRHTVFMMTSNACSDELSSVELLSAYQADDDLEAVIDCILPSLQKYFKSAFLGRVNVVPYFALTENVLKKIIFLKLNQLLDRIKQQYKIKVHFTEDLLSWILSQCQQAAMGARQVDNILNQWVAPKLAKLLLTEMVDRQPRDRNHAVHQREIVQQKKALPDLFLSVIDEGVEVTAYDGRSTVSCLRCE